LIAQAFNELSGSTTGVSDKRWRLFSPRFAFSFAWPVICVAVIFARLAHTLDSSWLIVLAPIWLPLVTFSGLLLAAMCLDQPFEC
jgi:hypothetical protein